MTFDTEVSTEVSDRIAEIGRSVVAPKPANYDSPEGVLFRKALALIGDEKNWSATGLSFSTNKLCSYEAVSVASGLDLDRSRSLMRNMESVMGLSPYGIHAFNERHTHAEVIAKWHEAGRANGWLA
jgi:uncharacterized protein YmfQ (DUF2313 family)